MPNLIKNGAVEQDNWTLLKDATGPEVLSALRVSSLLCLYTFGSFIVKNLSPTKAPLDFGLKAINSLRP